MISIVHTMPARTGYIKMGSPRAYHMSTETLNSRAERYVDTRGRIAKPLIGDKAIRPPHSQTALTLTDEAWKAFGKGELVVFSEGKRLEV